MQKEVKNMTQNTTKTIEQIVKDMKKSPIANLSLTSHELFHSNFLAWLCENYKEECGKLFKQLLNLKFDYPLTSVTREKGNIDIKLIFEQGGNKHEIWIENKIKSLPRIEQLENYSENVIAKNNTSLMLLSLSEPSFTEKISGWKHFNYSTFVEKLDELSEQIPESEDGQYHRLLIKDYIFYVRELLKITESKYIKINWQEPPSMKELEQVINNNSIKAVRLDSLLHKIVFDQIAINLEEMLKPKFGDVLIQTKAENKKPGQVYVLSGYSNGAGRVEVAYILNAPITSMENTNANLYPVVGVQVQEAQFRLFLVWDEIRTESVAKCLLQSKATDGKQLWFDFTRIFGEGIKKDGRTEPFNKFGKTFLHHYIKYDKTETLNRLLEKMVKYMEQVKNNQAQIEEVIAKCVQSQKPVKE